MKTLFLGEDEKAECGIYFTFYKEGIGEIEVVHDEETLLFSVYISKERLIEIRNQLNKLPP